MPPDTADSCRGRGEPVSVGAAAGVSLAWDARLRHDGRQAAHATLPVARAQSRPEGRGDALLHLCLGKSKCVGEALLHLYLGKSNGVGDALLHLSKLGTSKGDDKIMMR